MVPVNQIFHFKYLKKRSKLKLNEAVNTILHLIFIYIIISVFVDISLESTYSTSLRCLYFITLKLHVNVLKSLSIMGVKDKQSLILSNGVRVLFKRVSK